MAPYLIYPYRLNEVGKRIDSVEAQLGALEGGIGEILQLLKAKDN
jgi:hypothetical protein